MMENNANTSAGLSRAPLGKALVVGLGGCGIRILGFLRDNPRAKWLVTLAVDTDGGVLAGTHADAVINASADWNSKSCAGCGGDIIRGATYSPFMPLIAVALIYLVLVMFFSWLVGKLERRLRNSDH